MRVLDPAPVPHVAVAPLLPLVGLLLLAAGLVGVLVVLRRRRTGADVPDLPDLPALPTRPASTETTEGPRLLEQPEAPQVPAPGPVPTTYAGLARRLAEVGDLEAAVLCQWAADLATLSPHLAGAGGELGDLVGALDDRDPLALLRCARAAAQALVDPASPGPALAPLEDLAALVPAEPAPRGRHAAALPTTRGGLPPELWVLLSEQQRSAYDVAVGANRRRSA
ncbi:hypothetical protein BKA08_001894 [Nocardioides marinisabuli]|uniref:Uncharacterized protein n=1 Tax=Nocardioides marinisabuli TaxID=419476 RepID=A0A7Y9F1L5_9ACTN|nr:hypothetical protein [Nocardioides marinisabuli]NYD57656.1 hypothetical protein [Nocardioides marinisabuli]